MLPAIEILSIGQLKNSLKRQCYEILPWQKFRKQDSWDEQILFHHSIHRQFKKTTLEYSFKSAIPI
jgi:hypothetical protein